MNTERVIDDAIGALASDLAKKQVEASRWKVTAQELQEVYNILIRRLEEKGIDIGELLTEGSEIAEDASDGPVPVIVDDDAGDPISNRLDDLEGRDATASA